MRLIVSPMHINIDETFLYQEQQAPHSACNKKGKNKSFVIFPYRTMIASI